MNWKHLLRTEMSKTKLEFSKLEEMLDSLQGAEAPIDWYQLYSQVAEVHTRLHLLKFALKHVLQKQ